MIERTITDIPTRYIINLKSVKGRAGMGKGVV